MPSAPSSIEAFDPVTRSFRVLASTRAPVPGFERAAPGEEPKPRLESLESWDLARFSANPLVLVDHDAEHVSSIVGVASDVRETPRGLEMVVTLVSPAANPDSDRVAALLAEGALRGVSVGFEYGERTDEQRDGQTVSVFRHNLLNEVSLVTVPADPNALVTDAGDRQPDWRDFAHAVYVLRETALETGDPADVRKWHDAQADYASRFADAPRLPGQGAPRVAFDAAKQTRTTCSCPTYGGSCSCTFDPAQKVQTDMKTQAELDRERAKRDYDAAMGRATSADIAHQRQRQEAQQRRSRAPLFMTSDAWDVSQLQDRPNTSAVTPSGATAKPRSGDKGAKVDPDGAAAPKRAERQPWQRSFEGSVPGGMTKRSTANSNFAGMHSPVNFMSDPDLDPETAA